MRNLSKLALASAATLAFASPALAVVPTLAPCNPTADITPDAVTCSAFSGNLVNGNTLTDPAALQYLSTIGYTGDGSFSEVLPHLTGQTTINFSDPLIGIHYLAVHYGGAGEGRAEGTSIFEVDGGTAGISAFTWDRGGLSNAGLLGAGAPGTVPEPATWAMMLIGFGAAGFSLRRKTKLTLQAA